MVEMVDLPYMKPIPTGRFSPRIFPPDLRGEGPLPAHHSWQAWFTHNHSPLQKNCAAKKGFRSDLFLEDFGKLKMYAITLVIWQLCFEYVLIWFNRKV